MKILPPLIAASLSLGWSGCRDQAITAYRVPKDETPLVAASATVTSGATLETVAASSRMADTPVAVGTGRRLTWTAPAAWQAKPLGAMRKGSFTVTGVDGATADLSITAFPGAVGGDQANIDRWRGQLGLPSVPIDQLSPALLRVSSHGLTLSVVDFTGAGGEPKRLIGAIAPFDGATWFFKLLGPDSVVAAQKAAFMEFLQTIEPATEGAAP
jgi:hypothetical protein